MNRRMLFGQSTLLLMCFLACTDHTEPTVYHDTDITSTRDSVLAKEFDGQTITIDAMDEFGLIGEGTILLHQRDFDISTGPSEFDGRKPTRGKVTHNKQYVIIAARFFGGDIRLKLKGDNGLKGWASIAFSEEFREKSTMSAQ